MSEYQYVYFAAVDRALGDKQLEYMRRQSTRAEVTRWQFKNEYHYGGFSGNSPEMMQRGYDVHLHYANFGIRKLMFRLPQGLPIARAVFKAFEIEYCIEWKKDRRGNGGVLCFVPESDAGDYDEDYFEFDRIVAILPKIRESLIAGDLRPMYLAWLACNGDDEATEPPVPHGLKKLSKELTELATFYELSPDLLTAAAKASPTGGGRLDASSRIDPWLEDRSVEELRTLLRRVLDGEGTAVRAESLAAIREGVNGSEWPTAPGQRTFEELRRLAENGGHQRQKREAQARSRARLKRLEAIKADPAAAIAKAEKLVAARSTDNYNQAAEILAELREALGPGKGPKRADAAAQQLVKKHPTLSYLKRALRERRLTYK